MLEKTNITLESKTTKGKETKIDLSLIKIIAQFVLLFLIMPGFIYYIRVSQSLKTIPAINSLVQSPIMIGIIFISMLLALYRYWTELNKKENGGMIYLVSIAIILLGATISIYYHFIIIIIIKFWQ
jgi:cation transport ATPase